MLTSFYKDILKTGFTLTPSRLTIIEVKNKNVFTVKSLLDRELKTADKGTEVGSINYISNSKCYFIKAKALQEECFLLEVNNETTTPIRPQVFKNYNLKEGGILISKDSNIGEVVILDKNYYNYSISGALYKLPITKYKYYLFAFLKHSYFRKQLDLLVPKAATIRHAKTLFLNCKISFPTQKYANIIIE
jgi:restriction endonuclease S subunit